MMTNIIYTRNNDIALSLLSVAGHNFRLIRILTSGLSHGIMMSLSMSLPLTNPAHLLQYLNWALSVVYLTFCFYLSACSCKISWLLQRDQMKKTTFMNKWTKPILEMYTLFPADKIFCFQNQSRAPAGLSL